MEEKTMKPIFQSSSIRRTALLAVLALFALSVAVVPVHAVTVTPTVSIDNPSPVTFQASYAFNPFYSSTPSWTALNSTQSASVAWEAVVWNYLSYNVTNAGAGAIVRFASSQTLTNEGVTLVLYKNSTDSSTSGNCATTSTGGTCEGAMDVVYTDPTSQASIKIGGGDWITGSPIAVIMDTDGSLTVENQTAVLVHAFKATPMTLSQIGISGNANSPGGKNYNTAAGYLSVELGGTSAIASVTGGMNMMVSIVIAVVPLVVIVAVLKMLTKLFNSFG